MKSILITIVKLAIAISIIYYLVNSGKLNFDLLAEVIREPLTLIICFSLNVFILLLVTFRWKRIMQTRTKTNLPMAKVTTFNWIGLFFNSVLPGSVSGDIIKIFYAQNLHTSLSKKFLLGTVLIDRVMGLCGLIFVMGFFSILNFSELSSKSAHLETIIYFNFFLLACVLLGLFILFFLPNFPRKILSLIPNFASNLKEKLLNLFNSIHEIRFEAIKLIGLSVAVQMIAVFIFYFAGIKFATQAYSINHAYSIIPIGFIGITIPITPSGLGVGHAIFDQLFLLLGVRNGADLFNIFFLLTLVTNLFGIIPYILIKKDNKVLEESMSS